MEPLLLVLFEFQFLILMSEISATAAVGCPQKCGAIEIPYPFGIGHGCYYPGFEISCNKKSNPTLPILAGTNVQVLTISNGETRINSTHYIATDCIDKNQSIARLSLRENGPFTVSDTANSFMAVGCDTVAVIADNRSFTSGCVSLCVSRDSVTNGSCSGVGCCETAIPKGKKYLSLGASSMYNYANVSSFNNCSFAFVVEHGSFVFKEPDIRDFSGSVDIAMRLEWAIGNHGCSNANFTICGENSYCVDSKRGSGYICNCSDGFGGNPYLNGSAGCQDVDECTDSETNPCASIAHCQNKVPGFKCSCPFTHTGDGTKTGSGCRKMFPVIEALLGSFLGLGFLLVSVLWFYCALKKRSLIKLKEQFFRQNGGLLLKQQLSSREGGDCARIFTAEELKQATDNYNETRILGTGGHGTVYKGILPDGTTVAIKKSKVMDQIQIDQFINELVILTQINHRNVVKLLGCCLETEVPLLVYEFIPNGTLYQHIHGTPKSETCISWPNRLRISTETAEAIAYLHSAASMPIFHRDIKSSNILLDENFTAKVSDFGISRLVPVDQTQVPTLVQGTFGYLDPEYFQTSQLTAKSDVYSFGVVLVEMLTGEKPVCFERSRESSNLAMHFLNSMKKNNGLEEVLDIKVSTEGDIEQVSRVAELARKCLLLRGDKRPTMKKVAGELVSISGSGYEMKSCCVENEENGGIAGCGGEDETFQGNLTVTLDLAR